MLDENGHIIVKFIGKNSGVLFAQESGKHCVQRVPPTERNGRRQTSMISVMVLPVPPDTSIKPLPESELEVKFQTGHQKAGGQNVNKVASACRMKHIPTGMSVFINGRDQGTNKREALKILTLRVNEFRNNELNKGYASNRKEQWGGGTRSDKIRTYNFVDSRAVDHRYNIKTKNVAAVIEKGQFDLLMP